MSQAIANSIKSDIKRWADIDCTACYMEKGIEHKPSKLISGKEKGVYVFVLNEEVCFKVGKAGSGSAARWDSQHYNFDKSTPSTFTKSFLSDLQRFSTYFAGDAKSELHNFHQILCDKLGAKLCSQKEVSSRCR